MFVEIHFRRICQFTSGTARHYTAYLSGDIQTNNNDQRSQFEEKLGSEREVIKVTLREPKPIVLLWEKGA